MKKNLVYAAVFLLVMIAGFFAFAIYYQETYIKLNEKLIDISLNQDYWTSGDVTVSVDYLNKDIYISSYSFDGGNTWQSSNQYVVSENQILQIVLKASNGSTSPVLPYRIENIDKEKPEIVFEDIVYVARNSPFTFDGKYEIVDEGSGIKGDIQIEPSSIDTSKLMTYEVDFFVTDRALNTASRRMIVEVVEPNDPKLSGNPGSREVPVTGLTLSTSQISLVKGTSATITAHVKPSNATHQEVKWSSSNEKVATVDSAGNIQAISSGVATVSAVTMDGNKKSDVRVIVTDKKVEVVEIQLDRVADQVVTNHENIILTATIRPENATDTSITWNSSNPAVAIVSNGVVQIRGEGTTTITATTSNGKVASYALTVVDHYTFQEKEVRTETGESMGYLIKIYQNGVDITTQVSAITSPFTARNEKFEGEIVITNNNHSQLKDSITFTYRSKLYTATR